ncbi:MAG TPA: Lrp/AsnC family transcriptional regulator [Bradyrhizobium sp.]|uniref:Lrp/AsnC family transcriptional regulator n=1 Tax=Bradyrhizobium sp. TaxID=376 RepID=UPI002D7E4561|nr:Lrp/AsnC family transcriptional regulator [Bradyrhizobium sp.]HET7887218.1 Lrp/AsnC family transcriptional regulator [Bradyrhizobium sp.]
MKIDAIDLKILAKLQSNGGLSQRELADLVGLSQNSCWRRLQRLTQRGFVKGTRTQIDLTMLGLDLTVLVMVRTRHHSKEWADNFRRHVERLPEVIDFHRVGGDWDYIIKIVTRGMGGYDSFYQRLITNFDLERVTGMFSMEAIIQDRAPDLTRLAPDPSDRKKVSARRTSQSSRGSAAKS